MSLIWTGEPSNNEDPLAAPRGVWNGLAIDVAFLVGVALFYCLVRSADWLADHIVSALGIVPAHL